MNHRWKSNLNIQINSSILHGFILAKQISNNNQYSQMIIPFMYIDFNDENAVKVNPSFIFCFHSCLCLNSLL
jgi:hypothetical protein